MRFPGWALEVLLAVAVVGAWCAPAAPGPPAPKPAPEPEPVFEEDDALELTDEFEPEPVDEIALVDEILEDEGLLSAATTDAGASAFAPLAGASDPNLMLGRADRTLEALVREVIRPLLSTWLEANLPDVVERLVQAEIRKMSNKSDR